MPSETIESDSHTFVTIACLSDNYAFLMRDNKSGAVALIDVPEAAPIKAELDARGWTLTQIWLTHHHPDHVQGVADLLKTHPAALYGAAADSHRLPDLTVALRDGDTFLLGATPVQVIEMSGHTIGHIAFYAPTASAAFTADSLMALGCGRLFEGTPEQMHASLQKTDAWPDATFIFSGHEYTAANATFALSVDPTNTALIKRTADIKATRDAGQFTVPSTLGLERATNPFLRSHDTNLRATVAMPDANDAEIFAEVRARKDRF